MRKSSKISPAIDGPDGLESISPHAEEAEFRLLTQIFKEVKEAAGVDTIPMEPAISEVMVKLSLSDEGGTKEKVHRAARALGIQICKQGGADESALETEALETREAGVPLEQSTRPPPAQVKRILLDYDSTINPGQGNAPLTAERAEMLDGFFTRWKKEKSDLEIFLLTSSNPAKKKEGLQAAKLAHHFTQVG